MGREKNETRAELTRVQSRTWRNAGPPTGKYRFREVQGAAGAGMVNSRCCHRDPARNLEQGPEGPETPIQVVLRWV